MLAWRYHTAVSGKCVLLLRGGAHIAGQASPRTLLPLTPHTVHPAFEDGTDTGFRNVSQLQFDVGEIPKRTYTIPWTTLVKQKVFFYINSAPNQTNSITLKMTELCKSETPEHLASTRCRNLKNTTT